VLATIAQIALAAPIGFAVGVIVGLAASSRWRIVRREPRDPDRRRQYSRDRGAWSDD
jgi:hypothetical protein